MADNAQKEETRLFLNLLARINEQQPKTATHLKKSA
jgi:hypothetical protein